MNAENVVKEQGIFLSIGEFFVRFPGSVTVDKGEVKKLLDLLDAKLKKKFNKWEREFLKTDCVTVSKDGHALSATMEICLRGTYLKREALARYEISQKHSFESGIPYFENGQDYFKFVGDDARGVILDFFEKRNGDALLCFRKCGAIDFEKLPKE